ncbi:TMEM43 family protein [Aquisediminimonas sediminicola]|uniref:TMEM43 family protein n=1 Tax=Alteraquisediminimonas sediminicola TaxID=2676787 RepID=UPI001C8F0B0B|nr:TMEM43 family protein [Aquisediminimonas sediminicola]
MNPNVDEQRERGRFAVLTLLRAGGVIMMVIGIALIMRPLPSLPAFLGQLLFLLGVIESLVLPPFLARRWRDGRK